jgi:RHS repeat-associated protein
MAGISSKAAGSLNNRIKYNGKEEQKQEFADATGLDWYDYGARMYSPQIGMWNGLDPSFENYVNQSPYVYSGNNPVLFVDFDGNDYGVLVDRGKKIITISAHFLTTSKASKAFASHGSGKWNAQSGKHVFITGSIKDLKAGKAEGYKININVTSEILDGNFTLGNGDVMQSYTPRMEKVNADKTGTLNSFDEVSGFPDKEGSLTAGVTTDDIITMKTGDVNSGSTTHEVDHALGNAHKELDGTLTEDGRENSVRGANISETLKGVGIGGDNVERNKTTRTGDGTLLGNSTNQGLQSGMVISAKRYNRIMERNERRNSKKEKK